MIVDRVDAPEKDECDCGSERSDDDIVVKFPYTSYVCKRCGGLIE